MLKTSDLSMHDIFAAQSTTVSISTSSSKVSVESK